MSEPGRAEVARKSVHIGLGLACLALPWGFSGPAPVWAIAAAATTLLVAIRCIPSLRNGIGNALHRIQRPSYGEVLFGPAVATIFHLSGSDPILFCIPLGVLTLADAAGALGGTRWGRHRYGTGEGFKSAEGSAIFFLTAVAVVFLPLWLTATATLWTALWISMTLGLLAMMAEGIADRGFDNLIIPLGCFFVLERLLALDPTALAWRFALAVFFLFLVIAGSRASTLSGGALLGAALLGYGCAVLADIRFILPPLGVFLSHVHITRKHRFIAVFEHRRDAVISHAIACLPWVLAVERGLLDPDAALAGLAIAMTTQLGILDIATQQYLNNGQSSLRHAILKGQIFCTAPVIFFLIPDPGPPFVLLAIATTTLAILAFRHLGGPPRPTTRTTWMLRGIVSLIASTPALILVS